MLTVEIIIRRDNVEIMCVSGNALDPMTWDTVSDREYVVDGLFELRNFNYNPTIIKLEE